MKKRIIAIVVTAALCLSFTACSNAGSTTSTETQEETKASEEMSALEQMQELLSKDFKGIQLSEAITPEISILYITVPENMSNNTLGSVIANASFNEWFSYDYVAASMIFDGRLGVTTIFDINSSDSTFHLWHDENNKLVKEDYVESSKQTTQNTSTESSPSENQAPETQASEPKAPSTEEKNALSKAHSYLDLMSFSYEGLIDQLEYEGFSYEAAVYAVDNCGADWNEQAAGKAQSYMDFSSFSRQGLIDQLLYEGFTQEQAEYGVTAVGY